MGCLKRTLTSRKQGMMISRQSWRNERAAGFPKTAFASRTSLYSNKAASMARIKPIPETARNRRENAHA
jgi:hypothetical protein